MSECPLCNGSGEAPDRHVHFGDGIAEKIICPICRGTGKVEIERTRKQTITIIKPYGVWGNEG